ncbi:hypothetical protein CAter282_1170 [Collimonas arenae]|uniref:Uncharacterized protein n=1 Tax=Collimonas arenae TaxID=279058 RepID=A0A127QFW7_9BURK|nr:hypothetical protein CAter10_1263 [Collimonas arenae]AMP08963.1 hypothetical protein CAter282_1170 [Collimonas arenae]
MIKTKANSAAIPAVWQGQYYHIIHMQQINIARLQIQCPATAC